ncbi:MAG TPA: pilus assembly protein TadG-related protein [Chloroflexota bacterium]|nr:pilus assembly protein TadG-related protein [Chloroflexota bacterium]
MGRGAAASEGGQILLVIATALFFVMLGAAAVTVDLGNGLLQKRRLTNIADSAALAAAAEMAHAGDESAARTAAENAVSAGLGSPFSFPGVNSGSGTGLTEGIEFGDHSVRVALRRQVPTLIASVLGVNTIGVDARSKAMVGISGVLPISVKRFSAGNTSVPLDDPSQPDPVYDYLSPRNVDTITGSPRQWPTLTAPPSTPAGYSPPDAYDANLSGRVMSILGQDAQANVANGNDFHFWVIPDVRNVTHYPPEYYNGVTALTSVQQLKDLSAGYLWPMHGYPGPNPVVGEQIAVLNGVDTKDAVTAMKKSYRRGDIVAAMVYDGTVFRKPSFYLQIDHTKLTSSSLVSQPVTYTVTLVPTNNFSSRKPPGVKLWATGLEGWADWQVGPGTINEAYDVDVPESGATVTFTVSSTVERVGAKTATIMAYDPGSRTVVSISATVVVGGDPVFSVSCSEAFKRTEQGSPAAYVLQLTGENGYPQTDVWTNILEWYSINPNDPLHPVSLSEPPVGLTVQLPAQDIPARLRSSAQVKPTVSTTSATPPGTYMVRFQLWDGTPSHTQEMYLVMEVISAGTGTNVGSATSFVNVLGYANFVITYSNNSATPQNPADNNTVYGYAVSGLVADPSLLDLGLNPRLVGWSQ